MTARVAYAGLPGINDTCVASLDTCGIRTAYDVYTKGSTGLQEVYGIGPKRAQLLYEWAASQHPESLTFLHDEEYRRRLRILMGKHFSIERL